MHKVCRKCGADAKVQRTKQIEQMFVDRGLSPNEWPVDAPLVFRCPTHGLLKWPDVTHKKEA